MLKRADVFVQKTRRDRKARFSDRRAAGRISAADLLQHFRFRQNGASSRDADAAVIYEQCLPTAGKFARLKSDNEVRYRDWDRSVPRDFL
jgi:hypothetical protein